MAVLRRPANVHIGPFTFNVVFSEPRDHTESEEYGHTEIKKCEIWIDATCAESIQRETLMHELIHACFLVSELSEERRYRPERYIRATSPTLLDTLRRNPVLKTYLLAP